ncbi:hypothetical protein [Halorussus sp. GCM10023401]|uniref:hypothetical protein n=1 Tax=Halorussus sp. GCM10023401 TaxID=3252680 RepID=UPI00361684EA
MEDNTSTNNAESGISRRKTLKALGAAGLTLGGAPTLLGQATANPSVPVKRLTGTYKNPVSMDEIQSLKQRVSGQARNKTTSDGRTPVSEFSVPDDARIIDYIVTIGPNGHPVEHVDLAGDNSSVSLERGREQMSELESQLKTTGSDDNLSTQSAGGDFTTQASVSSDWNRVLSNSYTYRKDPYGEAFVSYVWWRLNSAEEPSGRMIHSVQTHAAMTPGTKIFDSQWHNEWLEADTFWNRDYSNPKVETWDPSSPTDSSDVGVSVGYPSGGGLSWSFENAGCIEPYYNSADPSVHWDMNCIFGNANRRQNTISMKPGSRAQMDDTSSTCTDGVHSVCRVKSTGHFEDINLKNHYLWQAAHFGYNC